MKSNLIEVKKSDFITESNDIVEGYKLLFLVPSKDNKYSPQLIEFYASLRSYPGQIIKEYLESRGFTDKTDIQGIDIFDISYSYNKEKKIQKLKYISRVSQ